MEGDCADDLKRPLALGADATRRIKRDIDLGDSSGRGEDVELVEGAMDDLGRGGDCCECWRFSDFVRSLACLGAVWRGLSWGIESLD